MGQLTAQLNGTSSLPVRGAWIEINQDGLRARNRRSRSPCGERGLKYRPAHGVVVVGVSLPVRGAWIEMRLLNLTPEEIKSLPVRGAWIEMLCYPDAPFPTLSLPVRGAWIEISRRRRRSGRRCGRSPCGERGLKSSLLVFPAAGKRRSPCGERGLK